MQYATAVQHSQQELTPPRTNTCWVVFDEAVYTAMGMLVTDSQKAVPAGAPLWYGLAPQGVHAPDPQSGL